MFANDPCEGSHECEQTLIAYVECSRMAHVKARCLHRLTFLTSSFLACLCGVWRYAVLRCGALHLMFPNWPGVAADDEGLLWLILMTDLDVDEAVSNLAGMAD